MTRAGIPILSSVIAAVLALGAIGSVAVVSAQSDRRITTEQARASRFTPPAISSPQPSPLPLVAIIGDGSVNQSARGVDAGSRWPAQIAGSQQVRTSLFANSAAGYTTAGSDGRNFVDQASRIPRDATLVIISGGSVDRRADAVMLVRAASNAIAAAKKRAPSASVLVVGCFVLDGGTTVDAQAVNSTLQTAATISNATFVDPIEEQWLENGVVTVASDLTGPDERRIAGRLETTTRGLLNGNT